MQVHIIDNFLSEEDCDYLIQYYKDYKNKDKPGRKINYGLTVLLWMGKRPLFDFKKTWIRYKYWRKIKKDFHFLKLNYYQIVFWPPSTSKPMHKDADIFETRNNDWTSVCYLNDDFEGGDTLIENEIVKPKKGTLTLFPSAKLFHGVSLVKKKPRYSFIAWWKENKKER